jgi:nitronate monooxygenase
MPPNPLLTQLGIANPIILAPLGGGPSTPELAAAVSNAGGLGSLGAAYLTPDQITDAIRQIKSLTSKPFNVNLFAGGYEDSAGPDPAPMLAALSEIHRALGLPAPTLPKLPPDPFPAQLEAVLAAAPPIFSFTFGIPSPDALVRIKSCHILTIGTATTVAEAQSLADAGVDVIFAQGAEAGGHRGTFAGPFQSALIPTFDLVPAIHHAVSLPVIASGGIMDGREIMRALTIGASAVALGTAFLACPESGASPAYKQAVLDATKPRNDVTVITRAFSGRPARGLPNAFIAKFSGKETQILPYPLQNILTRQMRTAAAKQGQAGYLSLWAGTGVARTRQLPAATLVQQLLAEMHSCPSH